MWASGIDGSRPRRLVGPRRLVRNHPSTTPSAPHPLGWGRYSVADRISRISELGAGLPGRRGNPFAGICDWRNRRDEHRRGAWDGDQPRGKVMERSSTRPPPPPPGPAASCERHDDDPARRYGCVLRVGRLPHRPELGAARDRRRNPKGGGCRGELRSEAFSASINAGATAVRLCPQGFLPANHHYAAISGQIQEIFRRFTSLVEPLS